MYNPFTLEGKTVLVTGASSGIGRGVAIDSSKMGASVLITGRNPIRLNETFSTLEGDNNRQMTADLCLEEDIFNLVDGLPVLNGVVLCAGIIKTMPVKNITSEPWLRSLIRISCPI